MEIGSQKVVDKLLRLLVLGASSLILEHYIVVPSNTVNDWRNGLS